MRNIEIAVCGAGLVGSLLAATLGRRGASVDVFERRPDMRKEKISAGRSINLAISARGLHALRQIGLEEEALNMAIPMRGRVIHPVKGELAFQRYGKDDSECIHSISRGGLNQALLTAAEATGRVRVHFNQRIEKCDPAARTLTLVGECDGKSETVRAGRVFGTDGSASAIRKSVLAQEGSRLSESPLDYAYKELHIAPAAGGGFQIEKNALHIWPRGTFMLIALPNTDGSFTVTLFLPLEGPLSFATLTTPAAVEGLFREYFPDAVPLLENLTETVFSNPTGRMVTVKCAPWNLGDWALLLGDAAHAIVPFFGQGMNAGFEDVALLMERATAGAASWAPGVFGEFSEARKPDADAIADLAVDNFIEMRDKVGSPRFLLEKDIEKLLEKEFPGEYVSRYRLVTFHRVPYRVALEVSGIQDRLLSELSEGRRSRDEVDLVRARTLIRERLGRFVGQWS